MGRLGRLGMEPAERYERTVAGELIHIDVKKLGRIQDGAGKRITGHTRNPRPRRRDGSGVDRRVIGWECVHIAIDDATRLAYAEVFPDEKATTAIGFLRRAIAFFKRHGMHVQELITDNGTPYISDSARDRVQDSRDPSSPHQAPQTPNQRQGRAFHPHHARRLGLRSDLRHQPRTHRSP